jgi:hypothetical protein
MNTKKIAVILIAVAFALVTLFSCFMLFSVKEVRVDYSVADDTDVSNVEKTLNGYLGRNLLFLNVGEVAYVLKEQHYMEVVSVQKQYPNVLSIKIEERRETYCVEDENSVYVTTEKGFVLDVIDKADWTGNTDRERITLQLKNIEIPSQGEQVSETYIPLTGTSCGQTLAIENSDFLATVFELAKKVNLTDCIKEMKVEVIGKGSYVDGRDIVITTYTGVTIRIKDADERGEEKMLKAFEFEADGELLTDYQKTTGYIWVDVIEVGENAGQVKAYWNKTDISPIM